MTWPDANRNRNIEKWQIESARRARLKKARTEEQLIRYRLDFGVTERDEKLVYGRTDGNSRQAR